MSERHEYTVTFTAEGTLAVLADSVKDAQQQAIDAIECLDMSDAETYEVESCYIRVTGRFTDECFEPVKGSGRSMDFLP